MAAAYKNVNEVIAPVQFDQVGSRDRFAKISSKTSTTTASSR